MDEIRKTFKSFVHDARIRIVSLDNNALSLEATFPSRGGERWILVAENLIHIDMSPSLILNKTQYGNLDLLPKGYADSRNFDYGGDLNKYRVIKFTDEDDKVHILVLYGEEKYIKET